jgi:type III restriction enzyme
VNGICARLSLRTPQRQSLEILHRIMEIAQPHKNADLQAVLSAIRSEFPSVSDFERAFPSLCFALATGVGKTRLMGAFIAYLHLEHGIRHFFVLAPNLTIYNKLVADFTPGTPKYVFQGIAEFAVKSPALVTGDNFEQRPQTLDLLQRDDVVVNIFNISKFNVRAADARKIRRLSEYLGQSYFDYLAGLDDLVLIMDEAHRYRADTSMKSIEELKPVLGLELTATPQVESGTSPTRFKNVIFDYPLAIAMRDGYVKEPAVATRANFSAAAMSEDALERLKLEDGIRVHESAKVDLDVYAQQNDVRRVKPFMLVIAADTDHANALVRLIEDEQFFEGRYKGRVIQVHSGQKGSEKDENVVRLLAVERPDEPTEIVVHVNMLKEGWDVTNLFTIVPLRAADSRTLVEQSIGRGLRLPYGRRTGVPSVDRLTIIAHDRFQDIVDEAKKGGYSFSTVTIGEEFSETPKQAVVVAPRVEAILGIAANPPIPGQPSAATPPGTGASAPALQPKFTAPEQIAAAKLTLAAIQTVARDPKLVPGPKALQTEEVQKLLVATVADRAATGQLTTTPISATMLAQVVRETTAVYVAQTIAIPKVIVLPQGTVRAGFHAFTLDLSSFRLQPVSQEILVQSLASDAREVIGALEGGSDEARLEDYVVRGLIDFDDVSYDEQAELLYALAGQVVAHLRSYLKDEGEVRNVLLFHQRQVAALVHTQMQSHAWEEASSYETVVSQGLSEVRSQTFAADASEAVRPFDVPIASKADIRKMLFGGFKKCLYANQKFDSDPERRFASVLENDPTVLKWFKPGKGVFQLRYAADNAYEPDFVVETESEKLICEPKRADQMQDTVVLAKAKAAATWCRHATAHETAHGGKPWRYVLIPHDAVADNMTLAGLLKTFALK